MHACAFEHYNCLLACAHFSNMPCITRILWLQIQHIQIDEPMRLGETITRVTNKLFTTEQKQQTNWIGANEKIEFRTKIYIFELIKGN